MAVLEHEHNDLLQLWESRQEEYEENLDSQKYHRDAEQAEMWIAAQEKHLQSEDYGVSPPRCMHVCMYVQAASSWFVSHGRTHWMPLRSS